MQTTRGGKSSHRKQCGLWQVQSVSGPHLQGRDLRAMGLTFTCHPQIPRLHPTDLQAPAALPPQPLLATPAPAPFTAWPPSWGHPVPSLAAASLPAASHPPHWLARLCLHLHPAHLRPCLRPPGPQGCAGASRPRSWVQVSGWRGSWGVATVGRTPS